MKNKKLLCTALPFALSALTAVPAAAKIQLYDQDGTTFSTDGLINAFYTQSSVDGGPNGDRDQARVRMGFLPNWIAFDAGKEAGELTLGARSSFWVTINDNDVVRGAEGLGTRSGIDVRQFYGTVDGSFGQVLIGKDFALFGRTNILSDELLLGHGQVSDTLGLIDGGNVSFGNIGAGYLYPFPVAQISYRTPERAGFQLAAGIMDPNKSDAGSSEDMPRFEAELSWGRSFEGGSFKTWVGGLYQSSETDTSEVDSSGVAGGANLRLGGLSLTLSGFDGEGLGTVAGLTNLVTSEDNQVSGYLTQASYTIGANRFVLSYGENESSDDPLVGADAEYDNTALAWFHDLNDNLKLVAELNRTEVTLDGAKFEETDTIAVGAVLTW
ncbi:hypothetical protein GCM10011348_00680 [Marinobacterium nitratireducens]|uniref:Porin domain-containing protein n=1 Tax=Marinobacterium nitratireducens TaxID=518897 RepID=A0A918DPG6_9GAMM|nr:porin [Marinobacterium nitratireducens]GGO75574.1 hypothetical protein GCM10011348_00680 [Marinobacterium nitratireducens]